MVDSLQGFAFPINAMLTRHDNRLRLDKTVKGSDTSDEEGFPETGCYNILNASVIF